MLQYAYTDAVSVHCLGKAQTNSQLSCCANVGVNKWLQTEDGVSFAFFTNLDRKS